MLPNLLLDILGLLLQSQVVLPLDDDVLHGLYKVHHNVQDQIGVLAFGRHLVLLELPEYFVQLGEVVGWRGQLFQPGY